MIESMLTTIDNPYNPFDDFDKWYAYDTQMGHHTLPLLARVTMLSDELSEPDQSLAIEDAIDIVVKENVSGMHVKVQKDIPDSMPVG